jgi:hypothetical protein
MTLNFPISKIISGGQTGVDRAALDWAISNDVAHGGWCPQGRLAEDGVLDTQYHLVEIENGSYRQRTKRNVMDSDGTLILHLGDLNGGTLATQSFTRQLGKPCYLVQLDSDTLECDLNNLISWIQVNNIAILNVAGPSASKRHAIYSMAILFMGQLNKRFG